MKFLAWKTQMKTATVELSIFNTPGDIAQNKFSNVTDFHIFVLFALRHWVFDVNPMSKAFGANLKDCNTCNPTSVAVKNVESEM